MDHNTTTLKGIGWLYSGCSEEIYDVQPQSAAVNCTCKTTCLSLSKRLCASSLGFQQVISLANLKIEQKRSGKKGWKNVLRVWLFTDFLCIVEKI